MTCPLQNMYFTLASATTIRATWSHLSLNKQCPFRSNEVPRASMCAREKGLEVNPDRGSPRWGLESVQMIYLLAALVVQHACMPHAN